MSRSRLPPVSFLKSVLSAPVLFIALIFVTGDWPTAVLAQGTGEDLTRERCEQLSQVVPTHKVVPGNILIPQDTLTFDSSLSPEEQQRCLSLLAAPAESEADEPGDGVSVVLRVLIIIGGLLFVALIFTVTLGPIYLLGRGHEIREGGVASSQDLTDLLPKRYANARVGTAPGERLQRMHWARGQPAVILTDKRIVLVGAGEGARVTSIDLNKIRDVRTSIEEPGYFLRNMIVVSVFTSGAGFFLWIPWVLLTRRLKLSYGADDARLEDVLLHVKAPSVWKDLIQGLRDRLAG